MHKKQLKRILHLDNLIESKYRQLDELHQKILSIRGTRYENDRVQRHRKTDPVGDGVSAYVDLYNEIQKDVDKLVDLKRKARREINSLEPPYSTVLEMRYLECMDWKTISCKLNYSISHIYRLHGEALEMLKDDSK